MASHPADTMLSELDSSPRRVKKPSIVPVGLNFGPTSLSIAFFSEDSEYYTGVPCDELYRDVFGDSLYYKVQCYIDSSLFVCSSNSAEPSFTTHAKVPELVEAFSKHIKEAIGMGISSLDNNPALEFKLMAVTVPDHWGESARTLVANATKLAGHPLNGSHMIVPLSRAIQSTFQMSKYTEGTYLTLILDYNKTHLHLMLVEMCGTDCTMKREIYCDHLGEDQLHEATILGRAAVSSEQEGLTPNVAEGEPSDGLQTDEASNSSLSSSVSSASDLIFPMGPFHTSPLFQDTAPTIEQPTSVPDATTCSTSETPTSEIPTSETPIIDHDTIDNPEANYITIPDEFNGQRPVCHNKAAHFKPIIDTVSKIMLQIRALETGAASPIMRNDPLGDLKYALRNVHPGDLRDAVRNVKYIVIDGEASIPGLWDLRDAIKAKFINEEWITVEGNKRNCGAYGAALAARRQLQNPKHFGDWKDLPGYVPGKVR